MRRYNSENKVENSAAHSKYYVEEDTEYRSSWEGGNLKNLDEAAPGPLG